MALSFMDHLSEEGINKWVAQIGVTSAPIPRQNIRIALEFFGLYMRRLPLDLALHFFRAMDLSRPVRSLTLAHGESLTAFRVGNEDPFKLFYTRSGASTFNLGLNEGKEQAARSIVRFKVRAPAPALESYTTGTIDTHTLSADGWLTVAPRHKSIGVMALGGDIQVIIPNSHSLLTMT